MQVKDYLQALSDESKIHVEKIGSGNWYWSFLSDEKKIRDNIMDTLKAEKEKADAAAKEVGGKVKEASENRGEDEGRGELVQQQTNLGEEVDVLRKELEGYKDADPGEVDRRRREIMGLREVAERWTDNIGLLETYVKSMMGGDVERLDCMKREIYGNEYVEGEGLREL